MQAACLPNGPVQIATVVDSSPASGPLTTTQTAFIKLAKSSLGSANVQIQQVCLTVAWTIHHFHSERISDIPDGSTLFKLAKFL